MKAIERIIREVAGRGLEIRYAIIDLPRGLLASNMPVDEARRLLDLSRPMSSILAIGETLLKRGRDGISTLFFRAGEGLLIVLSGPWAPQGLLASCARAIHEALGEELEGLERAEEAELVPARATPRVAWGKTVVLRLDQEAIRLLAQMDERKTIEEAARELGIGLEEALDIVVELVKARALLIEVKEES